MGSPRSPKSPKAHKARFRLPWDYRKKTGSGSPRIKNYAFFKSGEFARLMSSKDKKNARATLAAQQYLHGVFPDARALDAVAFGASDEDDAAAPSPFLAGVFGGRGDPGGDAMPKRAVDARAQ